MAGTFQVGETVVCSILVKDSDGTLTSPATSMTCSVYDPSGTAKVTTQGMTEDATGTYHYDVTTTTAYQPGMYKVYYIATDGTRVSIGNDTFKLENVPG